jgi:heme exporter protein B
LSLAFAELIALLFTLLIGFPALSALGLLGGLLTLNARGGGLLLVFLILPLTLPLLLFALSVMEMTRLGLDSSASFCLLTSTSLLLVILAMGIGSWALRFVGEE